MPELPNDIQTAEFGLRQAAELKYTVMIAAIILALVDLDEGFRFMCNVLNCDPATVKIGMRVRVCYETRSGTEQKVPQVEPAKS